jgi:hypothetical protein
MVEMDTAGWKVVVVVVLIYGRGWTYTRQFKWLPAGCNETAKGGRIVIA